MKNSILIAAVLSTLTLGAQAGPFSGKEMKQAEVPPCPEWYKDNEWNASLWGTYLFTNTDYARNLDLVDVVQSTVEGAGVLGEYDRYIGDDHAFGAGIQWSTLTEAFAVRPHKTQGHIGKAHQVALGKQLQRRRQSVECR